MYLNREDFSPVSSTHPLSAFQSEFQRSCVLFSFLLQSDLSTQRNIVKNYSRVEMRCKTKGKDFRLFADRLRQLFEKEKKWFERKTKA
jgi:hypothetical protein